MHFDWMMAVGSFFVAIVVGLTGMGGGALMTPMLTMIFNVPMPAAISSDLVAAAVMKPVGSFVHLRRGTVNLRLVGWLCLGSVPTAFSGVLVTKTFLGDGEEMKHFLEKALGVALLIAAAGLIVRLVQAMRDRAENRTEDERVTAEPGSPAAEATPELHIRPVRTVVIGAIGGLIVGITSVGSGSLIIVALLAVYPLLKANQLVGTDLMQAVPMVWAAAIGHILFGDFQLEIATALLVGSIPGVYLGARISAHAPGQLIRRALAVVLLASALKLLGVPANVIGYLFVAFLVITTATWFFLRTRAKAVADDQKSERAQV